MAKVRQLHVLKNADEFENIVITGEPIGQEVKTVGDAIKIILEDTIKQHPNDRELGAFIRSAYGIK